MQPSMTSSLKEESLPQPTVEIQPSKKKRGWNETRDALSRSLPPGPRSPQELGVWPEDIAKAIGRSGSRDDEEMVARLRSHNLRRIIHYGDYSGVACVRHALELGYEGFQRVFGHVYPEKPVVTMRECDYGSVQNEVLTAYALEVDGGKSCVLHNMFDRLPPAASDWVEAARPSEDMPYAEKVAPHKSIHDWLMTNRA